VSNATKSAANYLTQQGPNNESSEVCGIIKPGQRVQLNKSQAAKCPQTSDDSLFASWEHRPIILDATHVGLQQAAIIHY